MKHLVPSGRYSGMTLVELLVAMLLTAVLLLGLIQLVAAAGAANRLQDNQAHIQDQARFATVLLSDAASQAGYRPQPWDESFDPVAIAPGTADRISANSDRLAVRGWSDLNCFGNRNPVEDSDGKPLFYARESSFDLNSSGHLAWTCRYGPSASELVTQVTRQGLVPGVESFQLLFGEDSDLDGNVDRWVRAGSWSNENQVVGIRVGILLAGPDSIIEPRRDLYKVLNSVHRAGADGKLRNVVDLTLAIRSRNR